MNVLMISGDRKILVEGTEANRRFQLQNSLVDKLDVFVWPQVHSIRDIIHAVNMHQYDVITAQDPFWRGLLAWRISRRGAKLNLQIHTDLAAQPLVRRMLARFLLRRADTVRVVSQKIKEFVTSFHIRAAVSVLPVYIDLEPFRNISHRPHERFKKTILWIGRFESEKDPAAAVAILREVRAAGIDVGLIFLGAGSLEKELRTRVKDIESFVAFAGWQSPLPYLAVADVVVSTSKHESYGASIIEALAAHVPVVAPDVGVAKEAGAIVVERSTLARAVIEVLRVPLRAELKIPVPGAAEWARRWKESLV